ncbi:hypothetical protein N7528_008617 [Penicillium herquei]|nr:hypothetical protein N7528_008617 [Penicillium herquei]
MAASKALLETADTENERLLRTHHRTLAPCPFVYETTESDGKKIWVVSVAPNIPMYDTHAAGREIHIHPEFLLPQLSQVYSGSRSDPLKHCINPRRFLCASDLEALHRFFPAAIGVRVLISGFIIILFRDRKDVESSWLEGCVPSFGLLRLGYDIAVHHPNEAVLDSGNAVSKAPDTLDSITPLGLKLKFPDGSEGITVSTHAFVDVSTPVDHCAKETTLLSKVRSTFSRATALKMKECVKTGSAVDSPLGKGVWFAQEPRQKIGNISTTFDHHIVRASMFPQTIEYNISIITGDHLPTISNPRRAPKIVDWGDYREALDGHFALAMDMNVRSTEENRFDVFGSAQKVVVEGTEYLWDRRSRTQSAALLWRAMHDGAEMEGLSGSVLCLGELTDDYCRAVALKHFEIPICPQHFVCDHSARGDISWSSFKGGFLLPEEIRKAQILCDGDQSSGVPLDDQTWDIG